jgi:hypothetical protein
MDNTATAETCHQRHRRHAPETSTATLLMTTTNASIEKLAGDRGSSPKQHWRPPRHPTPCSTAQTHRQHRRQPTSFKSSANPPPREGSSAQHLRRRDRTAALPRRPHHRAPPRMNHTSGLEHAVSLAIGATARRGRPTLHRRGAADTTACQEGAAAHRASPPAGDSPDLSHHYLVDPSPATTAMDLPLTTAETSSLYGRCLGGDRHPP